MSKYERHVYGVGGHFCTDLAGQFVPFQVAHPGCKCDAKELEELRERQNKALDFVMRDSEL